MKTNARQRILASTTTVYAGEDLEKEGGFKLKLGTNIFRCSSPKDAYEKAARFIHNLEIAGFSYAKKASEVDGLDTYTKANHEISIGVHGGNLNLSYWH